jgi:hypothetical protein
MSWLLAALVLSGPLPAKRCASVCLERGPVWHCVYELQHECAAGQFECVDRRDVVCVPRVVNLGEWDPRPPP